jgi:DNA-binding helix-hairpin-helix protein with protein kinase domain
VLLGGGGITLADGRTVLHANRRVTLAERPLKSGGQAAVYGVIGEDDLVVKLYRDAPDPDQQRRVERMLRIAPLGPQNLEGVGRPDLAWPTAPARSADGDFLGYAMRRFGEPEHVRLIGLFTRAQRLRLFPGRVDWRFLIGVTWNLAFMTARMHREGLVVGDFSSNNVVVDRDGLVTFLDCDSIAFTDPDTGEYFPCLMQTADYCAPERHTDGPATPASDDFALAILIYQLLTAGNHPFGGVPHESHSQSTVRDNIAASCSYVVRPEHVVVPKNVIDPGVLPPALLDLARRAFGPGTAEPAARPTAEEWLGALEHERSRTQTCTARPLHKYGSHLTGCPWCEQIARTGHDPFNASEPTPTRAPAAAEQIPVRPGAAAGPAHRRRRRAMIVAAVAVAALIVLLVLAR